MKKAIVLFLFATAIASASLGAAPIWQAPQDENTARLLDLFVGTFVHEDVKVTITPTVGPFPGNVVKGSYMVSINRLERNFCPTAVRRGDAIFGEVEVEGTVFKFSIRANKDSLSVESDGEKFTFRRLNKAPKNPFAGSSIKNR